MPSSLEKSFDWKEAYKDKLVSYEEAAGVVRSGDSVFFPNTFFGRMPVYLAARKDELRDVKIETSAPPFDYPFLHPGMEESFQAIVRIYLYNHGRVGHDEGAVHFLPYTNGTWLKPYADGRPMARQVDVFCVEVSPPDEHGFCSFGHDVWERRGYADHARTIVAEVNDHVIRAHGDTFLNVSDIGYLVDASFPPLTTDEIEKLAAKLPQAKRQRGREAIAAARPGMIRDALLFIEAITPEMLETALAIDDPTEAQRAMAAHLKTLIRDGDTIQVGIGSGTRHIVGLGVFDERNDLGLFSEMACPGLGFLVKRGIATGRYADLHPGKAVFAGLNGMRAEEIRYAHDNPLFEIYGSDYVVNIGRVSRHRNMVAINNAVQIDLGGQISCESQFGARLINGPGGQIEFHMGAFSAPGGRAITMLPSTYGDGAVSNIKARLDEGALVSIPRSFADYVVTEYGVAQLTGKTLKERAEELIRVAHPDFRDQLRDEAKEII